MDEKRRLIVGNWKMNPSTEQEAVKLASGVERGAQDVKNVDVVVAPPFVFLSPVSNALSSIVLAAQDVSHADPVGSHTGEVSAEELISLGIEYVIVGHSDRRREGETEEEVFKKMKSVLDAGLIPILCVGESKEVRNRGIEAAKEFVKNQLEKDLPQAKKLKNYDAKKLIVAYEPIWAISTNQNAEPANPEDVNEMTSFIKEILNTKYQIDNAVVLYGGSTNSKNIKNFLNQANINGVLVGGSSLDVEEFVKMIKISSNFY